MIFNLKVCIVSENDAQRETNSSVYDMSEYKDRIHLCKSGESVFDTQIVYRICSLSVSCAFQPNSNGA